MKHLKYPFTKEEIRKFKVGDIVSISGKIFTGRDAVHKYLHDGNPSPINLKDQIIYHCGPVILQDENSGKYIVKAAGPTTSIREEPYQWELMRDHGILGVIGKGGMGLKTLEGCQNYGCVYFHAIGGAAQVLAEKIDSVENVYLLELGIPEAIWEFNVTNFPVVVTMDSYGQSLHQDIENYSKKQMVEALKQKLF